MSVERRNASCEGFGRAITSPAVMRPTNFSVKSKRTLIDGSQSLYPPACEAVGNVITPRPADAVVALGEGVRVVVAHA